jgi:hypothetical protein
MSLSRLSFQRGDFGGCYTVHPQGKSVAGAYVGVRSFPVPSLARVPHVVVFALPTMAFTLTSGSSSIFKDGRLKPGVYKIQNIHSETFLDVEVHSKAVYCRPAIFLGEGRGLVRPFQHPLVNVSDDQKWEIRPLGAGYSVQRVSVHTSFTRLSKSVTVCLMTRNPG